MGGAAGRERRHACAARSPLLEKDPKRRLRDIGDVRIDWTKRAGPGGDAAPRRRLRRRRWKGTAVAALVASRARGDRRRARHCGAGRRRGGRGFCRRLCRSSPTTPAPRPPAISPDGRSFAFVSTTAARRTSGSGRSPAASRCGSPTTPQLRGAPEYASNGDTIYFTRDTGAHGPSSGTSGALAARRAKCSAMRGPPFITGRPPLAWFGNQGTTGVLARCRAATTAAATASWSRNVLASWHYPRDLVPPMATGSRTARAAVRVPKSLRRRYGDDRRAK